MLEGQITLRVRPFERLIDNGADNGSLRCSGAIEDGVYVLTLGDAIHHLPTAQTGFDEWGPFAVLTPCEASLGSGFHLTVEAEPEDPEPGSPIGCRVAVTARRDPALTDRLLRAHGIDPQSVNLLHPPDAVIAIRFHAYGNFRGWTQVRKS
jgi:hypothetical protein